MIKGIPDKHRVAANGDRPAEAIIGLAADGRQLLLLGPRHAGANEDVSRASITILIGRTDDCGVAADGDRVAEAVTRNAVAGGQWSRPLLRPRRAAPHEDISRASTTILRCNPEDGGIAADGDRHTARQRGGESLLQ